MRKIIGWVLLGLGAFLLVTGLLATVWAPGQVERTPLDTDSTTRLSGNADKLNPATGELEAIDVKATSITKADSKRSDDNVIVFVNTTCLVIDEGDVPDCVDGDDGRLVSATEDVFATDRLRRRGRQRQVPPRRCRGEGGPRQQVALQRREEGLRLLGRPASAPR